MRRTKNDLPSGVRTRVCELLNARLADAVDLFTQLKQAHWTVQGPTFMQLHELFDRAAEEAEGWADLLAERVAQLGGTPLGTARAAAELSALKEYPVRAVRGEQHAEAVSSVLAAFGASMREAIEACGKLGDANAADICTEISRAIDTQLWFVESHLSR